jgi:adenylate cyclase
VGISEPVRIHEVIETKDDAPADLRDKVNLFHASHDLFEARNLKGAMDGFNRVLERFPNDSPTVLYVERCRQFLEYPPPHRGICRVM